MFYKLHRVYVLSWVMLAVGGVVWLYPRSGISEPLLDWYAVWQNKPGPVVKPVAELSGAVVRVIDGASFTFQTPDRQLYNVALLGVTAPVLKPNSPVSQTELAQQSQAHLSEM